MIKIENWSLIVPDVDPYLAPELFSVRLHGEVHGHPNFVDGEEVTTSPIVSFNGRVVKTQNSEYELGIVNQEYSKWYKENGEGKCDLESDAPLTPRNMEEEVE